MSIPPIMIVPNFQPSRILSVENYPTICDSPEQVSSTEATALLEQAEGDLIRNSKNFLSAKDRRHFLEHLRKEGSKIREILFSMAKSGSSADQMKSAVETAVATLKMSAEDIIHHNHSYQEKQKEVRERMNSITDKIIGTTLTSMDDFKPAKTAKRIQTFSVKECLKTHPLTSDQYLEEKGIIDAVGNAVNGLSLTISEVEAIVKGTMDEQNQKLKLPNFAVAAMKLNLIQATIDCSNKSTPQPSEHLSGKTPAKPKINGTLLVGAGIGGAVGGKLDEFVARNITLGTESLLASRANAKISLPYSKALDHLTEVTGRYNAIADRYLNMEEQLHIEKNKIIQAGKGNKVVDIKSIEPLNKTITQLGAEVSSAHRLMEEAQIASKKAYEKTGVEAAKAAAKAAGRARVLGWFVSGMTRAAAAATGATIAELIFHSDPVE